MPTVVTKGPFKFRIYPAEHKFEPPHVHVWMGNEDICRIELNSGAFMEEPPPGLRRQLTEAYRENAVTIRAQWDLIHGR